MEDAIMAVNRIDELLKPITSFTGDYSVVDSEFNVYNLNGERLSQNEFESCIDYLKQGKDKNRPCAISNNKMIVIYLPKNDEECFSNGNPNLDGLLTISEEVFHAQSPINNKHVDESLVLLGRYFVWRYLNSEFGLNPNQKDRGFILNKLVGTLVVKKRNDQYLTLNHKRASLKELVTYFGRLWLIGLVKELDELRLEDVLEKIKNLYTQVNESDNPIEIIEDQGLKHKTIPYRPLYEKNIKLLMSLNILKNKDKYSEPAELISKSSIAISVNNSKTNEEKPGLLSKVFGYFINRINKRIDRLYEKWDAKWVPLLKDNKDPELTDQAVKEYDLFLEKPKRLYAKISRLYDLEFKFKELMIKLKRKVRNCFFSLESKIMNWNQKRWENNSKYFKEFNKNLEHWLN